MKRKHLILSTLFVLELTLCVGIISIFWQSIRLVEAAGLNWSIFQFDRVSAESIEEKRFAINGAALLEVTNFRGRVLINAQAGDELKVTIHKRAWGADQGDAEKRLALVRATLAQAGNAVTIQTEELPRVMIAGSAIDSEVALTITVPAQTAIKLQTGNGRVELSNTLGDADLRADFGAISIVNVNGSVNARSRHGKVEGQRLRGDFIALTSEFGAIDLNDGRASRVNLASRHGPITLLNVSGDAVLESEFGALRIEDHAGALTVQSKSGTIKLQRVQGGKVSLESEFGAVEWFDGKAMPLTVETKNGKVRLERVAIEGPVTVYSEFGDIVLMQVAAAAYTLGSKSGKVAVDNASGEVKVYSEFGRIEIGGSNARLNLQSKSGAIIYRGSLGAGPHIVQNEFDVVQLFIPQTSALTLDLQTEHGQIKSDFAVTVAGTLEKTQLKGAINGGGALLTVRTRNGNILLSTLN